MTDAPIPDDIWTAAENALDNLLCNCVESCGGHEGLRKASIADIAKAILAERERCASLATRLPIAELTATSASIKQHELTFAIGAMAQRDTIAAAIMVPISVAPSNKD